MTSNTVHVPVLIKEVIESLQLHPGQIVVDGTLGGGGHAKRILKAILPDGMLIGLDRDLAALERTRAFLAHEFPSGWESGRIKLFHTSYRELDDVMSELHLSRVDRILLDLGLSSDQLECRERGFSFRNGGPLDLRFDTSTGISAADWMNKVSEEQLANAIYQFGEERFSRRIAKAIVGLRKTSPITTAEGLHDLIHRVVPGKVHGRVDSATRTFQALRIAVNEELTHLSDSLKKLPTWLSMDGIAAIISFHSLEDRLVKNTFRDLPELERLTKKPIVASENECYANPRSRSAKLRVAKRIDPSIIRKGKYSKSEVEEWDE